MKSDYYDRGRVYFPGVCFDDFDVSSKKIIEQDIQRDFDHALGGIMKLPAGARNGVFLAYKYYLRLFKKISKMPPARILQERIRIPDPEKMVILFGTVVRQQLSFL